MVTLVGQGVVRVVGVVGLLAPDGEAGEGIEEDQQLKVGAHGRRGVGARDNAALLVLEVCDLAEHC